MANSKYLSSKTLFALSMAGAVVVAPSVSADAAENEYKLSLDARYDSGVQNADGGTTEIVAYNKHNHSTYVVNGETKKVEAFSLHYNDESALSLKPFLSIDIAELLKTVDADFQYGDLTSIVVHPNANVIAASVQAEGFNDYGYAVFLTADGDLLSAIKVGAQPDNITISPDGTKAFTTNEGEPRKGYGENLIDPQGSISLIELSNSFENLEAKSITFEAFDTDEKRAELVESQVILKKDTKPSQDLEPEYVSVSEDSKFAYVALQENNAIAKIDLTSNEVVSVEGLGFKDFSVAGNEIDLRKDDQVKLQNENYFGIYMPDGMATYKVNGKNYIVTANEGDGREWGEEDTESFHLNENELEVEGSEIVFYDKSQYDGFEDSNEYIFGGRSFSIIDADTMEVVYDSGSDFERITAELFPENFNASNDKVKLDNRSGKKGPEPEDVKIGRIGNEIFAFVGLERIGGIMMYNVTDPANVEFVDYLNLRDFSEEIAGDVSPEGLAFVTGSNPQLIVGHEVSGTVTVLNLLADSDEIEENDDSDEVENGYKDIEKHWAKDEILAVTSAGLFNGVNDTTFAPNKGLSRVQTAIVLNRFAGNEKASAYSSFKDVSSSSPFVNEIAWAVEKEIMKGINALTFAPNKPITREEFAVAVYNYLSKSDIMLESGKEVKYNDDAKISSGAKQAVYALQAAGIIEGSDGKFNPNQPLTRAEAAIVFSKLID
ncbi:choice-of-anchor I family protein [Ureibacillus aquaedulcis]|uniref:Choice-of-anchor I family protein n=1 Tax=Ureibacillus aquaedulcis TaxID=3058421 RepID=A0ABT8GLJ6_9BACL|nr:choice-of-anchor I family protein [Ureibacillus sp. BA0131]MDN4492166.1 choice-of-anchor I family protein [Ureibacillus sp. BA0131]